MSLQKLGFASAFTALVLLGGISAASAHSRGGSSHGHGHYGHQGHWQGHGQKQCYGVYPYVRCTR